jgi:LysM repeat protein
MISSTPPAVVKYTVQSGDTLSGIAASHGKSLASVEAANSQITNFNMIYTGETVSIPVSGSSGYTPKHAAPSSSGKTYGISYGDPNYCGDGDGDGWDVACGTQAQSAPSSSPAPSSTAYVPKHAAPAAASTGSSGIPAWATCIVQRESGGNPTIVNQIDPGNGGGLFGDLTSTWGGYDGYAQPFDAPVSVQIQFNDALSNNGANLTPWAADGCPGT